MTDFIIRTQQFHITRDYKLNLTSEERRYYKGKEEGGRKKENETVMKEKHGAVGFGQGAPRTNPVSPSQLLLSGPSS